MRRSCWAGAVYWGRTRTAGGQSLTVYRYDLASRRTSVLFRGSNASIERSAAGFGWQDSAGLQLAEPDHVPAELLAEQGVSENWPALRSDGTSYAWSVHGYIGWWSKDAGTSRFRVDNAYVIAVAGPLVLFAANSPEVAWLDVRTGAVAQQRMTSFAVSVGHLVTTGDPFESGDGTDRVMRLDTSTLPPLTC